MVLKKEIALQIKDLLKENPQGLSITDIVRVVNINRNTAGRYLENLLVSGQVEMRRLGMAKIYMLSKRVPLSSLLSISSELVIQLDSSLRIIFANEPFLKLVGTESNNLLGKNIEFTPVALVFDEVFSTFVENIKKGITGKEWSGEIELSKKNIVLFCRIAPTVFEDGRKGVSVIFEDITQHKRAEEALQNSEMQYRSLVETTGTGYVIVDKDGRVNTANQEYVRLTGRSTLAEIVGRPVTAWTAPYDLERNAREIEKCFREGQVRDLEIDYQKPDGTIQPIEINASIIQSGSGEIILTLCRDITKRRQTDQKVAESERQFRLLAENSLDMICRIKPDGTRIYVSPAYKTTLGYEPDELIGKNHDGFIHPNDAHIIESLRNILKYENPSATVTFRTKHKDGHYIWIESAVKAIFDENTRELSEYYTVTRDITQQKMEQVLLQESEDKYRKLVEISPDAVIIHQEGKISYINPAGVKLLGASQPDEIIGKNVLDSIHPDFHDSVMKNIEKDLKDEISPSLVLQMIRLDGTSIIVEGRGIRTSLGGKPAIQVAIRDITESKRAEAALRESEGLYRTLAEASSDLIYIIGRDDRVEYINSYAAAKFDKPIDQIISHPRSSLFPPEVEKNQKKALERVFNTGITARNESLLIFNEQTYWFDHFLTPLKDPDGHVRSVLGISRDITERKRTEIVLGESEDKYRTLVDRANDVICIIQDGVIKMCNPRLSEFWGGSIEEIIGKPISGFIHPDALPEVIDRYNRRLAGESPPSIYETILMRKDGSSSYVELNAGIISYEGKKADLVIIRDINERKKAEQALRESEATARALLNAPTDSVILIDDHGIILTLNEIAASRFGRQSDELVGILSYDLLPKDVAQLRRTLMAPVLEKREMVRFSDERDGRWYDTVAYPIINQTGDVKKIAIIARDVTEQKNIEKSLHKSEKMYKRLLEQSFDAIAIHKEGKIAYLNERAAKILGAARPEDLVGRPIFDFIHPESRRDLEDRVRELGDAEGMSAPVITEKFFRTDGSTITVEVMAISFDDNGIPAFRVAFREISNP
jgi:PAS domain S-box-containing protein